MKRRRSGYPVKSGIICPSRLRKALADLIRTFADPIRRGMASS